MAACDSSLQRNFPQIKSVNVPLSAAAASHKLSYQCMVQMLLLTPNFSGIFPTLIRFIAFII